MRYPLLFAVALLASCANVTDRLDEATGTTLEQRCETRRSAVAAWDAIVAAGGLLSPAQETARVSYQIYIDTVCPPVE